MLVHWWWWWWRSEKSSCPKANQWKVVCPVNMIKHWRTLVMLEERKLVKWDVTSPLTYAVLIERFTSIVAVHSSKTFDRINWLVPLNVSRPRKKTVQAKKTLICHHINVLWPIQSSSQPNNQPTNKPILYIWIMSNHVLPFRSIFGIIALFFILQKS